MKKISVGLISFVMVSMYLLGYLADTLIIQEGTVSQQEMGILLGISCIGFALLCAFLTFGYKTLESWNQNRNLLLTKQQEDRFFSWKKVWRLTAIISGCYLPYLVLRFPGHVDVDTYWEILEMYGLDALQDHHPFFDTVVFGLFWKLGDVLGTNLLSVLIYALLQSVCTAFAFAMCLVYMEEHQVPKWISRIAFCFAAFFPAIPMMAQTMAKDTLHAWLFVLFFLGYVEAIRTKGEIFQNRKYLIAGVCIITLLFLTKKTGIYVVCFSLLLLYIVCKNRKRLTLILVVPLVLYFGLWSGIVLQGFQVSAGESREMMSVPSQQVAALFKYNAEEMTEEDEVILSGVYNDLDGLVESYSPTRADATKSHWKEESTNEERAAFYQWYLKQWVKHPKTMLNAMVVNAYGIFAIDTDSLGNESYIFYQDSMVAVGDGEGLENTLASFSSYDISGEAVGTVIASSYRPVWADALSDAFDTIYLKVANILHILFSKVLYATWIPLLVVGYALYQKNGRMLIACIPVGLLTGMLLIGPIVLPRYMACSVYDVPMLLAIPFVLSKEQKKESE